MADTKVNIVCRRCRQTPVPIPADLTSPHPVNFTHTQKINRTRRNKLLKRLIDLGYDLDAEDIIILEGPEFDKAIVGLVESFGQPSRLCYDMQETVRVIRGGRMSWDDAWDYFYYNTIGAYMGESTPVFLRRME